MFTHNHIYLLQTGSHIGSNTFQRKKKNYIFVLSSPTFYDFDVLFYIFMFILLLLIVVIIACTKNLFLICILAYLSDLQSFYIFASPIVFSPFLQILASFLFREDLSIFLLGQLQYRCILLVFACLRLLFSPILNYNLAGQSILGCRFFPFGILNISCHSLLACKVSVEKSADSLMGGFPCN